jgi:hypothetical protein
VTDYKERLAFVEADPTHQKLQQAHRDLYRQLDSLDSDLRSGTYGLQRLLLARDCVQHYADEISCTSSQEDEQLEQWTATHGEGWFGMYSEAAKEITESVLDLCSVLTAKREQRNALRQQKEASYTVLRQSAEQLERDYAASKAAESAG